MVGLLHPPVAFKQSLKYNIVSESPIMFNCPRTYDTNNNTLKLCYLYCEAHNADADHTKLNPLIRFTIPGTLRSSGRSWPNDQHDCFCVGDCFLLSVPVLAAPQAQSTAPLQNRYSFTVLLATVMVN